MENTLKCIDLRFQKRCMSKQWVFCYLEETLELLKISSKVLLKFLQSSKSPKLECFCFSNGKTRGRSGCLVSFLHLNLPRFKANGPLRFAL